MHSLILVDDHYATLLGLRALIGTRPELRVAGMFSTGDEALRFLQSEPVDIVCLDLNLPGALSGFEICQRITKDHPGTRVVIYTGVESASVVERAHEAGATGVVSKGDSHAEIVKAVLLATTSRPYTSPGFLAATAPSDLSDRQRAVLRLLADGLSTDEIASKLEVSGETVRTHVKAILSRLEAQGRTHAVAIGFRNALID